MLAQISTIKKKHPNINNASQMRRGSLPGMPCQFEIPSFKGKNVQNAPGAT